MKISVWFIFGCMMQVSAHAADFDHDNAHRDLKPPSVGRFLVNATLTNNLLTSTRDHRPAMGVAQHRPALSTDTPMRKPAAALAIERAAKKGIVELAVEGYSEVLIQCQKSQSAVLTMPFLRSDSQQAHCYRFYRKFGDEWRGQA